MGLTGIDGRWRRGRGGADGKFEPTDFTIYAVL